MFAKSKAALLPLLAIAGLQSVPAHVHAQSQTRVAAPESSTAPGARPDPANPKAPVAVVLYRSRLSGYQAFSEAQVAPWRETNELVRQRGGWRAYAREAGEPDGAPPSSPAPSTPSAPLKPAASDHSGHEMK